MEPKQRKEATSIAGRAINWLTDKLGITESPTYTDGYGVKRRLEVPFWEGAQGQELKRMGETAGTAGSIGLLALSSMNPSTVPTILRPIIQTLGKVTTKLSPGYWASRAGKPVLGTILNAGEAGISTISGIKAAEDAIKNKDYENAAIAATTSLITLPGLSSSLRLLNPHYRAYHAYNVIDPRGYNNPVTRGKDYLSSMLEYKTYTAPKRDKNMTYAGDFIPKEISTRELIGEKGRDDAWRIYLGLEPQNNYYIKNSDGTYSYNLSQISEDAGENFKVLLNAKPNNFPYIADYITGAHGGLYSNNINYKTPTAGTQTITDVWDLNPFSRETDMIGDKLDTYINGKVQNFRTMLFNKNIVGFSANYPFSRFINKLENKTLNKFRNNSHFKWLNKPFQRFEIGYLVGGKPFTMQTEIPFKNADLVTQTADLDIKSRGGVLDEND